MLFEDKGVTVSNSKRMLCANDKLIRVARMLKVVNKISNKASKNIIEFKITL
jgi:hypothetical protein